MIFSNKILKLLSVYILVILTQLTFSQVDKISYFPNQNIIYPDAFAPSAICKGKSGELFIFHTFSTFNSLFFSKSTDKGVTWQGKQFITAEGRPKKNIDAQLTTSGRIIVVWQDDNGRFIRLTYSDNNGQTWSEPGGFIFLGDEGGRGLNISQLDDDRIIIALGSKNHAYYYESFDDGLTWSIYPIQFPVNSTEVWDLNIISIDFTTLLSTYSVFENESWNIYYKISMDNGISWYGPSGVIADSDLNETRPELIRKEDGSIYAYYNIEHPTYFDGITQTDLYSKLFNSSSLVWLNEKKVTSYLGSDDLSNLTEFNGNIYYTLSSSRNFNHQNSIHYGIAGISNDQSPPAIYKVEIDTFTFKDSISIKALIDSEFGITQVKSVFEDSSYINLFDDGLHSDGAAEDKIFGNKFIYRSGMIKNYDFIDVNNFFLPFMNDGNLATSGTRNFEFTIEATDLPGSNSLFLSNDNPISWKKLVGTYLDESILFAGGLCLSGFNYGELWANGIARTFLIDDYLAGNVGDNPEDLKNKIYTVRSADEPFGDSWLEWKNAVLLGAKFYDGDGDGIYNPVDKNWNGTWEPNEDMPYLLGDITSWCIYNDGVPASHRRFNQVNPLGIKITQLIFASSKEDLNNIVFLKYSIENTGTVAETLDSVIFGIFIDPALGDWSDDLVGCDTLLYAGFCYNEGDDSEFGSAPPSLFVSFLQGPKEYTGSSVDTAYNRNGTEFGSEQFIGYKNIGINSFNGFHFTDGFLSPSNREELRNLMKGLDRVGTAIDPCSYPAGEVRGGIDCNDVNKRFWFSGDPVTDSGWIDIAEMDKIMMINSGQFTFEKGKSNDIIIAYVIGQGTDAINSITVARENVKKAIAEYQSNFASMTYVAPPPTNPVNNYVLYHNYPNPFNPATTIRYEIPQDGLVTIKVYDILGQEVTTLLNEFKKANRYEVKFNAIGLASGVYIYRMKVNEFIESKKMILLR